MTVYVDDFYRHSGSEFRGMRMSHMIADTDEELHAMADKLGLRREWFQGDHYDVAYGVRHKATKLGAIQIDYKTCSIMTMNRRAGWPIGSPEFARTIFKVWWAIHDALDERKH